MKKVMVIIGTRPEAIKMFPVIMELKKHKEYKKPGVKKREAKKEMIKNSRKRNKNR